MPEWMTPEFLRDAVLYYPAVFLGHICGIISLVVGGVE